MRYRRGMTSRVLSIATAYAVLGLEPGAGIVAAKRNFRDQVKKLHPDITDPTPEALGKLADIVGAIRYLEHRLPACIEVQLTPTQAKRGLTRSLRSGEHTFIVRIPPDVPDGACLSAVGDPDATVQIRILKDSDVTAREADPLDLEQLDDFIEAFSRPSANARFARWIRKAQSAA